MALLLNFCSTTNSFRSEKNIRDDLLKKVPFGTNRLSVKKFIKKNRYIIKEDLYIYTENDNEVISSRFYVFLKNYQHIFKKKIYVTFVFNSENYLINLIVYKSKEI